MEKRHVFKKIVQNLDPEFAVCWSLGCGLRLRIAQLWILLHFNDVETFL